MYKEIYGKYPPKNPKEFSRMMNFEIDDDYFEPDDLFNKADELIVKGEYGKSLVIVDKALSIFKNDEEMLLMRAEILNYLDRFDESEAILKKLNKLKNCELKSFIPFHRAQRYFFRGICSRH
ncbi:hypothetical protein COU57_06940 [Candidatus Pacearchaeota archaeon CG10_big_fil_rev_8_21_14_0_10_32_14]|nr:MAG: hypothetical protein COU57_06940 [Candidatus Pacearchaeota archaeon CG10_big_fil_rev_8_21_14_0_10_32_14]